MMLHRLYRRFARGPASSFVLMYHRIAQQAIDPWELCVSPDIFRKQLEWITAHYTVLPLNELVQNWSKGRLQRNSVAITFDDGYEDNYREAVPALKAKGVSATFFITDERQGYWWDVLDEVLLRSHAEVGVFNIVVGGKRFDFSLEGEENLNEGLMEKLRKWKATSIPTTKRAECYLAILNRMKDANREQKAAILQSIKSLHKGEVVLPPLMQEETIHRLAQSPIFTIGCHTASHPQLSSLNKGEQQREIEGNKRALEKIIGKPVTTIAYPYGSYNEETLGIVKALGFGTGVTTQHYSLRYAPNDLEIGRYNVSNLEILPFL